MRIGSHTRSALALCGLAVALIGCSPGPAAPQAGSPGSVPAATAGAPVSAPPAAPGSAGSAPSAAGSTPVATSVAQSLGPCGTGAVIIGAEQMSPATLHRGVRLTFSLVGAAAPCALTGYPGVDSGAGGPLLHATRTPRGFMGGLPAGDDTAPPVRLDSGHLAHAIVEGVAVDAAGNGCPQYTSLLVTPPDSTETSTLTVPIDTCALQVHPVTG
ncbi:DUF4232 domain-containing protein [Nocardia sp. alder85J]|uniref:DUF4232 domain-containing protein n=1 Tax=Nocardia sp. alder85J TaxID=2862949 RepID=UPI001CD6C2C9|nr:DUF4232 domain-containing protein [Nocardia sp. alder85J]MCX4091767.1 DUF4232 domain-containing protein [Nocardia sp. alder85J]